MSFKPVIFLFLFLSMTISVNSESFSKQQKKIKDTEWTIALFMESSTGMNQYAIKNITDFVRSKVGEKTNILIQWHSEGQNAWRFHFDGAAMQTDTVVKMQANMADNVYSCMKWAVTDYPAQHYGLVLWGHGFGVLDPTWNAKTEQWEFVYPMQECCTGKCSARTIQNNHARQAHRGVLSCYQEIHGEGSEKLGEIRTYLSTKQLRGVMKRISHSLLNGAKLDFLGTDSCVMSMLEVMYQIAPHVSYFTGAQDCELADGYNYQGIMRVLNQGTVTPRQLAQTVVSTFSDYYRSIKNIGRYTQAAIDVSQVMIIKQLLDTLTNRMIIELKTSQGFSKKIMQARRETLSFCLNPTYVDLHIFLQKLDAQLRTCGAYNDMSKTIRALQTQIDATVIANTAGDVSKDARGISIYFPTCGIDPSYLNCAFALDSHWVSLLKLIQSPV